jgi:hypothetical protein
MRDKKKTPKEMWNRILPPSCLGNYDCCIRPNPRNLYYPKSYELATTEDIKKACPYLDECYEIATNRVRRKPS